MISVHLGMKYVKAKRSIFPKTTLCFNNLLDLVLAAFSAVACR